MTIAIIGAGQVGTALGQGFAQNGHKVVYGVRDSSKRPGSLSVRAASQASEVVVLAVPWSSAKDAVDSAGDLSGKVVIDATNPLKPQLAGLELGTNTSAGETIQQWIPKVRVVKAFNTIGYNIMDNTSFSDGKPLLLYCGNDADAKKVVHQLASELGFEPQDAGPIEQCRLLEPFAMLWISLAYQAGLGREFAFRLLHR